MLKAKETGTRQQMMYFILFTLILFSGCSILKTKNKAADEHETKTADRPETASRQTVLTLEALKNSEYRSEYFKDGQVRLINGKYENADAGIVISLSEGMEFGDMTGDGIEDAVVVLVTDAGGSGVFYDLAIVVDENGAPSNVASVYLGDRVKIEALYIEAQRVVVSTIMHGETDPACCPTLKETKAYKLQGNTLVEQ